ncbi:FMN-dependent oxidoreductase, nitrilotriacetate monooxygenase [Bibersteinia trehalosi USDA-ARS-USMARC-189]|uniref:FMN-dependent oxidoreductase, nitrilotriacetate monooxygenase n=1 Tax=Bibersteinia trehalosi USDA-ARS-USMARC-189 TaxID=1263831 RepID=A0ABM5PFT8_BIBTR|nr:NtaA/DmoA family FMN-dependent monooxygenase [Bibersteinia trehalosi]AGH37328.1 FMN-dependent oxidoreductase, nitrilotriacetate monooxygenase [Bibersteinia trehalosi USDA-ARS-USMARC-192]AHG85198.1 FMN-dependent oxidoreductase, nitrilotriacetate monooxygenase [Bibersteinia trehalosi USDA-ARS-USMARC-189]
MPESNEKAYTDIDYYVEMAKTAEQGKIHTLFIADTPSFGGAGGSSDIATRSPAFPLEPMVVLSAVAYATQKIGIVATFSTTYNLPYNLARQLKTLDTLSKGRLGWNAVTTGTPFTAYNFGNKPLPDTTTRYEMAHEMVEAVQTLWGTFGENAYITDKTTGQFADMSQILPANYKGKHYQVKGALPIPATPQGQPPIFQAGPSPEGIELAGRFASGVYANPFSISEARAYRNVLKQSAIAHGRNPDEINMFSGFMFTIGDTYEEALARRMQLLDFMSDDEFYGQIRYLSAMIGVNLHGLDLNEPLPEYLQNQATPHPNDPRSPRAVELIKKGMSPKEVLANGVINYHSVVVGTATDVADFMEEWFRAGATDGFSLAPDSQMGVREFVEKVVPILQERGIYHTDYEGNTLREHLGVGYQYGLKG